MAARSDAFCQAAIWYSLALNALGDTHLAVRDPDTTETIFEQAVDLAARLNSERYAARSREGLAHVAAMRGDHEAAEEHWEAALAANPGGVIHPSGAKLHLKTPGNKSVTRWRCGLRPDPAAGLSRRFPTPACGHGASE